MRRLIWLDSVRGIAAILVVLEHFLRNRLPSYPQFGDTVIHIGHGAVIAFLLVSGYVIPMTLEGRGNLPTFWRLRIFRLFPMYAVVFAVTLASFGLRKHSNVEIAPNAPLYFATNAFMVQGWFGIGSFVGVAWSLCVEMGFYVAMSLLFWKGLHKHTVAIAWTAILLIGAVAVALPKADTTLLVCYLTPFIGVAFFRYDQKKISLPALLSLVGAGSLVLAILWALGREQSSMAGGLCGYALFGLFFAVPALGTEKLALLAKLGAISYSIYLIHPFFVDSTLVVGRHIHALQGFWAAMIYVCAITICISALTYKFIETPCNRFAKHVKGLLSPVLVSHSAEPLSERTTEEPSG